MGKMVPSVAQEWSSHLNIYQDNTLKAGTGFYVAGNSRFPQVSINSNYNKCLCTFLAHTLSLTQFFILYYYLSAKRIPNIDVIIIC